jgi:GH15 family glucan-1,4-alpha-glucosidase
VTRYPPISDYAFIGDCHSAALVSHAGSIDWCCMPRFDSGSCFGRLLDWDRGGYCSLDAVHGGAETTRAYLDGTLVLETRFRSGSGEARVLDCFTTREGGAHDPHRQLIRVVDGERGVIELRLHVEPRFDYGEVRPWIRQEGVHLYSAIGGDDALVIWSDGELKPIGRHELGADLIVRAGQRARVSIAFTRPEEIDADRPDPPEPSEIDERLDYTIEWWRRWTARGRMSGAEAPGVLRSATTLKALQNAPTGAIAAAATTSLPEALGGSRNWDYRFSWVRDSAFSVRALTDLGFEAEADGFRRFVQRSSAGSVEDLQVLFGLGGERRIGEWTLDTLDGYAGSRPVRIGNAARDQLQLDAYGELVNLAWRWHERGHSPDDDLWRFLVEVIDAAAERWEEPDSGIWEWRDKPLHFVHSKACCWAALDRGITLADESMRRAPLRRWRKARDAIAAAIDKRGYDRRRRTFVQAFNSRDLDASVLLLPTTGFLAYEDERMIGTVDAIRDELSEDGLIRRYRTADGLEGEEGAFLACSFWLAECLAHQGRLEDARETFDRTLATANDLGLFAEEFDPRRELMLGNFPQALTHLSHITAALALSTARADVGETTS